MARTEPTTCTGCQREYDAPVLVAAFEVVRLCPICTKRIADEHNLWQMEAFLESAKGRVYRWERKIRAHKAAHPPLVKLGQGEYEREIHR